MSHASRVMCEDLKTGSLAVEMGLGRAFIPLGKEGVGGLRPFPRALALPAPSVKTTAVLLPPEY